MKWPRWPECASPLDWQCKHWRYVVRRRRMPKQCRRKGVSFRMLQSKRARPETETTSKILISFGGPATMDKMSLGRKLCVAAFQQVCPCELSNCSNEQIVLPSILYKSNEKPPKSSNFHKKTYVVSTIWRYFVKNIANIWWIWVCCETLNNRGWELVSKQVAIKFWG